MDQVLRTAALWMLGSKTPAADAARLQRGRPLTVPPVPRIAADGSHTSATIGRSFEDRVLTEIMPQVAVKLGVTPASRLCRVTRSVPHCGDFAIHYAGKIGMIELKNHSRALPVVDRRRFFDAVLLNYKHLDWAILVTSHCSVPKFAERGYVVVGQLIIPGKTLLVAFVCSLDTLGASSLELAIRTVSGRPESTWPQWKADELVARGEASRSLIETWGSTDGRAFQHPAGSVFA
jgi:hypothetical protein